jgi:hypothetical protein
MRQVTLICLLSVLLCSCEKLNIKGDIQSENDIRLNTVQKVIVTRDNGLLIAGVYDSKVTFIKTDENFRVIWMKDDYEWGKFEFGTFGGGSTYVFEVINLFQDEFNNFICTGSVTQGGCVVYNSIMIVELNQDGKEMEKAEFKEQLFYNAMATADGGYLFSGVNAMKLNKKIKIAWEKNYPFGDPFTGKVINTRSGRYAMTAWDGDKMFIKTLEPDGDESMSEEFSFSEINFNETGNDLIGLEDGGFIIAGRSRTHDEPWDMDCGITRLNSSGKKIWTKTFGTGSDEWLDEIIWHSGKEFIMQGSVGYPAADVQKTILIKIDQDGAISDSLTTDRIGPLINHPHEYFIKYQNEEDDCIHFEKIPLSELFK